MALQLAFDFSPAHVRAAVPAPHEDGRRARVHRGTTGYHAGVAAELRVAQDYERRGYQVLCSRWRGQGAEIDLVIQGRDEVIFVEVKKSRTFDRALDRLSQRQILRLFSAAEEFVGTLPGGALTAMRFDVALMDERGMIRIMENALML